MRSQNKQDADVVDITEGLLTPSQKQRSKKPTDFLKSIRSKAVAAAVSIGLLPLGFLGVVAYVSVSQELEKQVLNSQRQSAQSAMSKVERFTFERYGDIRVLANLVTTLRSRNVPIGEQKRILEEYRKTYQVYDSIAVTDAQGTTLLAVGAAAPRSFKGLDYYEQVIATQKPVFNQPRRSVVTNRYSLFFAAPIFEKGKLTGMVRTRVPLNFVTDLIQEFGNEFASYLFVSKSGEVFLSNEQELIGKKGQEVFPALDRWRQDKASISINNVKKGGQDIVGGYAPWIGVLGLPDLEWGVVTITPEDTAFASIYLFRGIVVLTTILVAIVVVWIAYGVTSRAVQPILSATKAVQKIGEGDLSTRIAITGDDELAVLGKNINILATQLNDLLEEQRQETERIEAARQEARAEADARAQEQQEAAEFLQRRALELLIEVDPVSKGDLTVRAQVTPDEVGTIADSYNAIIRSLRQIVEQVQVASGSVVATSQANEEAIRGVAEEYLEQVNALKAAVASLGELSQTTQGVADRALSAKEKVQQANQVVSEGDQAMNRTVAGISGIQETVTLTAEKVKLLGEASQKISRVVGLISEFTAQTKLLALNAAIEAARAGDEGLGFGVVADEVRTLAEQSAAATAEIKQLVEEIQSQTRSVATAMQEGTDRVAEGTKLVETVREKLTQIAHVSTEVSGIVEEIAQSAGLQFHTSERVRKTMETVATIAETTSQESENVAASFTQLLHLAEELQSAVKQFKVS